MRRLLRGVGARVGISVGLVALVAVVLAIARLGGGPKSPPSYRNLEPSATVAASAGDDGREGPTPSTSANDDTVRSAATAFVSVWLRRDIAPGAWHSALAPLATTSLADSLAGVDPTGVPATRIVGEPRVTILSDLYAQVSVPVDTGSVVLGLQRRDSRWLVDTLDWERT